MTNPFEKGNASENMWTQNQVLALRHNYFLKEKGYISQELYESNLKNIEFKDYFCSYNHLGEEVIISCKESRSESCLTFDLNCSENGAWVSKNLRKKI